ncbi:sarcosine oxidase [Tistlia consotensis]|uniref:Sarcosine oxidase n=1 Tax=Tistlia consotensis USBA 355 TaxID=560819 RepID=A0A1Y6CST8_9PROT|nr:FAD-binding oxidoreductase [Tistlia consotensis]SMF75475.1 sarcosine oxidase [Tistlia consotensis USBA 355]SNS07994.1 sarcosine oxidase [Tistlia consotensis]
MSSKSYDVVVIGGGVIGSAVAYWLAAEPAFAGRRVLVVERDSSYQECSTGRSAGAIRQQFSTRENIEISLFGAQFIKNVGDWLAVDGEAPALSFRENGFLFLASAEGWPILEANHRLQKDLGADNALLPAPALKERLPWLEVEDLAGGCLGLSMEGWLDPFSLLQGFRRKARALGADYVEDTVVGVSVENGRATGVTLASGETIAAGWVVNAAGPRSRDIAAMAGLALPVAPRKRQVFVFDCKTHIPTMPLVIDPSGLYFRPEGAGYICGIAPKEGEPDPDSLDLEVDWTPFEEILWPGLAARVPAFESIKPTGAWAGHYSVCLLDHNAVLGPHPELPNFLFANGFSGHGLQQSPAVGRGIMELIVHDGWRSLDLSRFGYERILRNEPVLERNVV